MADDYDNTDDLENLTDDELKTYIESELGSQGSIDARDVTVRVTAGAVSLEGRVGTEEELRIIDHVITDVIGLSDLNNELVVDDLRRAESPEAIDEHLVDESERGSIMLGDRSLPFSPEAEHLGSASDVEATLREQGLADVDLGDSGEGTHDVSRAIEGGEPWIPPESPTPEGVSGQEDGSFGIDGHR